MVVVLIANLYTVRLVFKTLGVIDYGIFDVITGITTILITVTGVLSTATQRFYSISFGEKNLEKISLVFSTSLKIYFGLSMIIILFGQTIGVWFINSKLNMPIERLPAVHMVFQFSLFSSFFMLMQVPYFSAVIAKEDLDVFSFISLLEVLLKVLSISIISKAEGDKLIFYGIALFIISILVFLCYFIFAYLKYPFLRFKSKTDKVLLNELVSFSSWSLFGSLASVSINQFITILMNISFGPSVNATRAISLQVYGVLGSLTSSIFLALRPQMIQSYSEKSFNYLNSLFNFSNKAIYYGLLIICIPLFIEMESILVFWLSNNDPQTILFCRLILVYGLIMALNNPISIIIQATGHVKVYHLIVEFFTLLCGPISLILFKAGFSPSSSYYVIILMSIFAHVARVILLRKFYNEFDFPYYIKSFLVPAFAVTFIAFFTGFLFSKIDTGFYIRIPVGLLISLIIISVLVYFFGLSGSEKLEVKKIYENIKLRLIKNGR